MAPRNAIHRVSTSANHTTKTYFFESHKAKAKLNTRGLSGWQANKQVNKLTRRVHTTTTTTAQMFNHEEEGGRVVACCLLIE